MKQSHQNKNFYGRRKSYKLSKNQQALYDKLYPEIAINIGDEPESGNNIDDEPESAIGQEGEFEKQISPKPINPKELFSNQYNEIWLEIGFGGGEHLIWQAKNNKNVGIIGCEPYLDGIGKLLYQIASNKLNNIRIYTDDATHLLCHLPAASINKVFLLYPDPWPKKRHHKRRFINHTTISFLSKIMNKDGIFYFSSDIEDYIFWCLKHFQKHSEFNWLAQSADDRRNRADDWPQTRYEQKALTEGRTPAYLKFQKIK